MVFRWRAERGFGKGKRAKLARRRRIIDASCVARSLAAARRYDSG